MDEAPIEETEFRFGPNVVNIGDIRVARGLTRRPISSCTHRNMVYDTKERRVWCSDCEVTIESFDAFIFLVEQYHRARSDIEKRAQKVAEAEATSLRSLAARELDKAWSKRRMIPCCPSCGSGLFPEDFKRGVRSMVSREFAEARRKHKKTPPA